MNYQIKRQIWDKASHNEADASDINIAENGCSGFATSTQKGPFMAMLISRSKGTYLILGNFRDRSVLLCPL